MFRKKCTAFCVLVLEKKKISKIKDLDFLMQKFKNKKLNKK